MEYGYDSLRVSYLMMIKWVDMASLCAHGLGSTERERERESSRMPSIWLLWSPFHVVVLIVVRWTWERGVLNRFACVCGV